MTINRDGALTAMRQALDYAKPDNEADALEKMSNTLHEYIDNGLMYHSHVIELWDGYTHNEVDMGSHDDIMDAITYSTYFQLRDEWDALRYDVLDEYISENLGPDTAPEGRDEDLWVINGPRDYDENGED